jgi:hypothetical protein
MIATACGISPKRSNVVDARVVGNVFRRAKVGVQ